MMIVLIIMIMTITIIKIIIYDGRQLPRCSGPREGLFERGLSIANCRLGDSYQVSKDPERASLNRPYDSYKGSRDLGKASSRGSSRLIVTKDLEIQGRLLQKGPHD